MNCEKCDTKLHEGKLFCPHCGHLNPNNDSQNLNDDFTEIEVIKHKIDLPKWYRLNDKKIIKGLFSGLGNKWKVNPYILRATLLLTVLFPPLIILAILLYFLASNIIPLVQIDFKD